MPIADFPGNLSIAIQEGHLERRFIKALQAQLGYRGCVTREVFNTQIGETTTKTRGGLLSTNTTPLDPTANTNFDNGLTPTNWNAEQYTMSINQYGDTMDLNLQADKVGIATQFLQNAYKLGEQSRRSLDQLVRQTLLNSYMGGNTRVTVTLGAPNVTINVDDIRGFQFVIPTSGANQGKQVPVSVGDPMDVRVGDNVYTLNAAVADLVNASSVASIGGISGTLTFSAAVIVADGTLNQPVIGAFAPEIVRPNDRETSQQLVAGDILTIERIQQALTFLDNNAVPPTADGMYHMYISPNSMKHLFADPEFRNLVFGTTVRNAPYDNFFISEILGVKFIKVNTPPVTTLDTQVIERPILVGGEAVVEGVFAGTEEYLRGSESFGSEGAGGYDITYGPMTQDIAMINRMPLDRLKQIIAQTWLFAGGWVAPTDALTTPAVLPTATDSYYKRAVLIETASK